MEDHFEMTDMIAADSFAVAVKPPTVRPDPELPSPDTRRWVVRRKAVVVQAVRNGTITLQEACRRYSLSVEEFLGWQRRDRAIRHPGPQGHPAADLPRHRRGARGEIWRRSRHRSSGTPPYPTAPTGDRQVRHPAAGATRLADRGLPNPRQV